MVAVLSSIHESDYHRQLLLNDVVQLFTDLLAASGATMPMIEAAMQKAVCGYSASNISTNFTDLGALLRDCMEVMCRWRRDVEMVDIEGEPLALPMTSGSQSFESLCRKTNCRHPAIDVLSALRDFGAVSVNSNGLIQSETPTFLLGRSAFGGRLATDALLKHLKGFLDCVHRNVRSVSGAGRPKFERACTVTVARELEPIFDRLVRHRGQEFIDSIDEWLERNTKIESPTGRYLELGAGAYFVDFGERQAPRIDPG
jgi:hypothetical protein